MADDIIRNEQYLKAFSNTEEIVLGLDSNQKLVETTSYRWKTWAGASRTDDDTISSTTHLEPGIPIRYKATSGSYRYGIVKSRSTNAHDILGEKCTTDYDDVFEYGEKEFVEVVSTSYWNTSFNSGDTTNVLALDYNAGSRIFWYGAEVKIVGLFLRCEEDGTNTNSVTWNAKINTGSDMISSDVAISDGWTDSGTNIQNNDLGYGDEICLTNPTASGDNDIEYGEFYAIVIKY